MPESSAALAALLMIAVMGAALRPPNEDRPPPPVTVAHNFRQEEISQQEPAPPPETAFVPLDVPLSIELQRYAAAQCALYEPSVSFEAVIAVIEHESYFDAAATHINRDGTTDYGLMQINERAYPQLHKALGVAEISQLLDPYVNVSSGVYLLALHMADHPGSLDNAMMGYQLGPTGARRKLEAEITSTTFSREMVQRTAELAEQRENQTNKL